MRKKVKWIFFILVCCILFSLCPTVLASVDSSMYPTIKCGYDSTTNVLTITFVRDDHSIPVFSEENEDDINLAQIGFVIEFLDGCTGVPNLNVGNIGDEGTAYIYTSEGFAYGNKSASKFVLFIPSYQSEASVSFELMNKPSTGTVAEISPIADNMWTAQFDNNNGLLDGVTGEASVYYYAAAKVNEYESVDGWTEISIIGDGTIKEKESSNSIESSTYTAYLLNPSETEIAAGSTFTTDVYMAASDGKLSGGQLELDCEGGTITNIALADGLTNGEQSGLSKISFYGNTGDAANGIKVATVTVSTEETASGPVVLSIKEGKAAVSGNYSDKDVTLEDATKSVTVNIKEKDQFSCNPYADAAGKYLVQYTGAVDDGKVVQYTSGSTVTDLYYSEKYQAWVFLADSDLSSTLANADFSVVTGDKTDVTIQYNGDVNKNGTTNIVDAQIAYDISNNVYPTFEALPMNMWLSADVNTEFGVAAGDARAIQCIIHGIQDDSVSA